MEIPDGIDSYEGPVRCIIKYVPPNSKNLFPVINQLLSVLNGRVKDGTILIAINGIISKQVREYVETTPFSEYRIPVVIWDQADLFQMVDPESDYANYLINPKQALIEDALQPNETDEEYYKIVHTILYSRPQDIDTSLLGAIARISTPHRSYNGIKSIVTYNFDDLLERKFRKREIEYHTVSCENDMSANDKLNIYHVHGYLPSNISDFSGKPGLIFSEEDYHRVYRDAYSWSNLVQLNAFRDSTCVFIGCSLTDPNLRRLLDVASRNGETPRHYAFMKKKSINTEPETTASHKELLELYQRIDDKIREGYFRELGLNIIWIDEYEEIPEILLGFLE